MKLIRSKLDSHKVRKFMAYDLYLYLTEILNSCEHFFTTTTKVVFCHRKLNSLNRIIIITTTGKEKITSRESNIRNGFHLLLLLFFFENGTNILQCMF